MKANGANKTEKIPEQSGEGVQIIQGVISFLSLFLPVALAKRAAAMILRAYPKIISNKSGLMNGNQLLSPKTHRKLSMICNSSFHP